MPRTDTRPHPFGWGLAEDLGGQVLSGLLVDQMARTFSAWGPLGPWVTSNSTFWFSSRDL
jgi:hypothetical protein